MLQKKFKKIKQFSKKYVNHKELFQNNVETELLNYRL